MKYWHFLFLVFLFAGSVFTAHAYQKSVVLSSIEKSNITSEIVVDSKISKKKMIIFSSRGGYGHQAASRELESIFSPTFDVKTVYWFEEGPFKKYDTIRNISFGSSSGESFYNFLLKNQWMWLLRTVVNQGAWFAQWHRQVMEEAMYDYLDDERPDMIISVAPIFNLPAVNAAARLSIPYILTTLDADLSPWSVGLEHVKPHAAFAVTIGYDAFLTRTMLEEKRILASSIHTIGIPISSKFFVPHDKRALYKKWNLLPGIPVILIMMGGVGTSTAYTYAQKIAQFPLATNVLVCAGNNEMLRKKINKIKPVSKNMRLQALSFVHEIDELMFLADLLITKGGGMTMYQAIASKTPVLCHAIGEQLPWEKENIHFITEHHLGYCLTKISELDELLQELLRNPAKRLACKKNMEQYHPIQFHTKIKQLVIDLMNTMAEEKEKKRYVLKSNTERSMRAGVLHDALFVQQEVSWLQDIQYRLKRLFS